MSIKISVFLEAVTGGPLQEKVFLEISKNSQENTCARASFLTKLQTRPATLLKKRLAQVFSGYLVDVVDLIDDNRY